MYFVGYKKSNYQYYNLSFLLLKLEKDTTQNVINQNYGENIYRGQKVFWTLINL